MPATPMGAVVVPRSANVAVLRELRPARHGVRHTACTTGLKSGPEWHLPGAGPVRTSLLPGRPRASACSSWSPHQLLRFIHLPGEHMHGSV